MKMRAIFLSLLLIPSPHAFANPMISTSMVVDELEKQDAKDQIGKFLKLDEVRNELLKHGLTTDEAEKRIANLNQDELRQMHAQIVEARAGGDILVTVLLVVLIIYLVKRI